MSINAVVSYKMKKMVILGESRSRHIKDLLGGSVAV